MKAFFTLDFIKDGKPVTQSFGENLVLDSGIKYLIGGSGQSGNFNLFGNDYLFNLIQIGSSSVPPAVDQSGLLKKFWEKHPSIVTCDHDDFAPYVFYTAGVQAEVSEGIGEWAEISLNGWNRSLFSSPGMLTDGTHTYLVSAFNASGESLEPQPFPVLTSSPAMASGLQAQSGALNIPHKVDISNKVTAPATYQLEIKLSTTVTAVFSSTGDTSLISVSVVDPTQEASDGFNLWKNPDGSFFMVYQNQRYDIGLEGDTYADFLVPPARKGAKYRVQISPSFVNTGPLTQPTMIAFIDWNMVHSSSYRVSLKSQNGGSTVVSLPNSSWNNILGFWQTGAEGGGGFKGEVYDCPYFKLSFWPGIFYPGASSLYEFTVFGSGQTGGAYIEWQHPTSPGPSGYPSGYRVYRRNSLGKFGLVKEVPVIYTLDAGGNIMSVQGDRHCWDGGFFDPLTPPAFSSSGPSYPDANLITTKPLAGFVPKPIIKDANTIAKVNAQIFFYDRFVSIANGVAITPATATIRAGSSIRINANAINDYGDPLLDRMVSWKALDGGTISPASDTLSALYSDTMVGTYHVNASSEGFSAQATISVQMADTVSISSRAPLLSGNDSASATVSTSAGKISVTLPYGATAIPHTAGTKDFFAQAMIATTSESNLFAGAIISPGLILRVPQQGTDAYGNTSTNFNKIWYINGLPNYAISSSGVATGAPFDVNTQNFTLLANGDIQLHSTGTAIIEVRELLPGNIPGSIVNSFSLTFSWR